MSTENPTTPAWLKPAEACAEARIGRRVLLAEIRAGRLKAARIGGRREYRISRTWLHEWLSRLAERT